MTEIEMSLYARQTVS